MKVINSFNFFSSLTIIKALFFWCDWTQKFSLYAKMCLKKDDSANYRNQLVMALFFLSNCQEVSYHLFLKRSYSRPFFPPFFVGFYLKNLNSLSIRAVHEMESMLQTSKISMCIIQKNLFLLHILFHHWGVKGMLTSCLS